MSDDWGEMADAALGESNKTNKPQATISNDDEWGTIADGASSGATKSVKPAAVVSSDDWGAVADAASGGGSTKTVTSTQPANDDDWGSTSNTAAASSKPKPQPVEDDWCSAGPTAPSNSNTTAKAQPVVDDWCSAGPTTPSKDNKNSGGREDWGGNSTRKSGGRNDWGGNSTRKSGGRNDWSGNSTRKSGGGDDWGGNSAKKSGGGDDWGGTSTGNSGGGDDWGGTTTGNSGGGDDWGGTSTGNSGGRDRPNRNRNNGDNDGNKEGGEERPAPYKPEQLNLEEEAELQAADAGENFQKYKEQVVNCIPPGIVEPVEKFDDVVESKLLLENLKKLKYTEMTPIQKWAMPAIKDGHDIIGCAQTGSGKTAAFLLPVLQTIMKIEMEPHDPNNDCQSPYCLIISPTRELAKQIYTHAELLSKDSIVKCRVIYGQVSTFHLKAQMSLGCHILVATMGKLKDFLERKWIDFKNIKWVILDEGDRLVDEKSGNDVNTIFQHETMPSKENRQTLFFSATFKESVQESAREFLRLPFIFLSVGRVGAANEDIRQEFIQVARENKKSELKGILKLVPPEDKTIVFTQTKAGADMLAAYFTSLKLESTSIHGDRHQSQREEAISLFRRGKKRFLISSPVGNRGLDLPKVTLVINYDLPECVDEYVHRIGRTGRAGHTGKAISFYDPGRDRELVPELLRILRDAKQEIPDWLESEETGLTSAPADDFFGTSEKRPADDEAGNESKKVDTGEQPAAAAYVEEEW